MKRIVDVKDFKKTHASLVNSLKGITDRKKFVKIHTLDNIFDGLNDSR